MRESDTSTGDGGSDTGMNRRDVLKSTAGVAAGGVGLAAATGPASATLEALLEGLQCSSGSTWQTAPTDYPVLDLRGETPERVGDWPDDPEELTVFVHGLGADSNGLWRDIAYTFENAAAGQGFTTPQIAVLYDTAPGSGGLLSGSIPDWSEIAAKADVAGRRLASWLKGYDAGSATDTYRIVAHSLGGRVTGTTLNELGGDVVVEDAALLGPAIPSDSVCEDGTFAPGIRASAESVVGYHSWDDEVVCDLYSSSILGAGESGVGCKGAECGWFGDTPDAFEDDNVTYSVDTHCDYPRPEEGCVDDVVGQFRR